MCVYVCVVFSFLHKLVFPPDSLFQFVMLVPVFHIRQLLRMSSAFWLSVIHESTALHTYRKVLHVKKLSSEGFIIG